MTASWEIKAANKVFTAILNVEHVPFNWALQFRRLQIPGPDPVGITARPFDHARNDAVKMFLNSPCEWLFFLDSDVLPPADAVPRLLAWNRPVISGMYCRRSPPHALPVMMIDHQWVTDLPTDPKNPLKEVELVGAGCLLVHRTVYEELLKFPHRPGKPWYDWRSDLHGIVPPGEALSEDYSFNYAVRKHLKIPILVDTSVRCLHIGLGEAAYGTFLPAGSTPWAA